MCFQMRFSTVRRGGGPICYLYVAVASAFIPYVHASATLLDPCMYIHFLQSLSIVLHLCLKWCTSMVH